jgi:plastocyanin
MHKHLFSGTGIAFAGALLLVGCGGGGGSTSTAAPPAAPSPAPTPSTVTVNIVSSVGNTAYQPNPVRANTGDTVVFRNNDATMHHIMLDDGSADLGDVGPGATSRGLTLRNSNAARFTARFIRRWSARSTKPPRRRRRRVRIPTATVVSSESDIVPV